MSVAPKSTQHAVAKSEPGRDALGKTCFYLHIGIMVFIVLGWALPSRAGLIFYVGLLPCVVAQWALNKNSCVLNNAESWLRSGRWRDPANAEEGAWFVTLVRNALGWNVRPIHMDIFLYGVLLLLWGLGLANLVRGFR